MMWRQIAIAQLSIESCEKAFPVRHAASNHAARPCNRAYLGEKFLRRILVFENLKERDEIE